MPIQFRCPTCNKLLSIASRKAGQSTECPICGEKIDIPQPNPSSVFEKNSPIQTPQSSETTQNLPIEGDLQLQKEQPLSQGQSPTTSRIPQTKAPKTTRNPSKSILDIDPDSFFGTTQTPSGKPLHPTPKPGILDDMYDNQGENAIHPEPNVGFLAQQKEGFSRKQQPSWKMIVFGILIITGMVVALYYAWNLGYPKALWST